MAEVQGLTKDKIHHRIRETAKRLGMVYLILTAVEVVLLVIGKMDLFDAICHAFTTIATGGFSTKNSSFAAYSPYIQYVVVVFMMLAGINFTLHYYALSGKLRKFWGDEELRFYVIFIFITSLIIAVLLFLNHFSGVEKSIRNALFQVTSIITTTGFVSSDYLIWPGMMWFFVFLLFFAGACSGSTAGSIKMIRHIFLFKNFSLELKRLLHPNAVLPVQYNGKPVPKDSFLNVQVFFLFYMVIFALGSLIMSTTGLDFKSALGAVASSLGNIGPGLGTVGPMGNFAHVSIFGKWFLSFMMLLGRLELFTVMILLSPAFWRK
ncbi:MAG: Trk system potassium uptake protein TrkH [Bacteroidetes bacterium ADurb.Bin408]|nr:MAG: Trk system potassium uptake protein TrkH [Bacteroidetes bacterium ADurb.Bin408]